MNSFFSSKVHGLKSSIQSLIWSPENCQNIMKNKKCKLRLQFPSKLKIAKILKNLSNSRCSAIDGLDIVSLKVSSDNIAEPIHHIATLSIMQEHFPDDWKKAKVIPLHKKGDTLDPKNYRPVSILSPLSKVLERVVHDQLYEYFSSNTIIHQSLHGYRKNRSTLTALLQMYEKWVRAASDGKISGAVFVDLSAAFDLVSPDILLKKLDIYGLDESFQHWIKDYLTNRYQAVWIDHCFPHIYPVNLVFPKEAFWAP